jgi:hypothetical protein
MVSIDSQQIAGKQRVIQKSPEQIFLHSNPSQLSTVRMLILSFDEMTVAHTKKLFE